MQFGFMAGRSTADAIFIVHQLQDNKRNIWQRIRNFGWLLWIWRRRLTRCLGGDLVLMAESEELLM